MIILINDSIVYKILQEIAIQLHYNSDLLVKEYSKINDKIQIGEYDEAILGLGRIIENITKRCINKILRKDLCKEKASLANCLKLFEKTINLPTFKGNNKIKELLNIFSASYYTIYRKRNIVGHTIASSIYLGSMDLSLAYMAFVVFLVYVLKILSEETYKKYSTPIEIVSQLEDKNIKSSRAFAITILNFINNYGYNDIPRKEIAKHMKNHFGYSESTVTRLINVFYKKKLIIYNKKRKTISIPRINYIKLIELALGLNGDTNE